jgi:ankyrin repeat protein
MVFWRKNVMTLRKVITVGIMMYSVVSTGCIASYLCGVAKDANEDETYKIDRFIKEGRKEGTNVTVKNRFGITSLHLVAMNNDNTAAVIEKLIEEGIDINAKDRDGCTPLHLAALNGRIKPVVSLFAVGAKMNEKNNVVETPRDIAINRKNDMVADILEIAENLEQAKKKQ